MACLKEKCAEAGQEHLLQFWDELTPEQQRALATQINSIDLEHVTKCFGEGIQTLKLIGVKPEDNLEPPDPDICGSVLNSSEELIDTYRHQGTAALGNNEVAVMLFAGGQGSRLGASCPKGMYDIGLPSGKTLYQLHAERILKLQTLVEKETGKTCHIPWYIMTSRHTKNETAKFLEKHAYFGLKKENVILFEQNMLPCFDTKGKILLESPYSVAFAPEGNGNVYRAIQDERILEDLVARGVKFVHVCCVDNILLKIADPVFIGFCQMGSYAFGVHAVERTDPTEALSVSCKVNGTNRAMHYYEIKHEVGQRRNSDGRLLFNSGITGAFLYTTEFLQYLCRTQHWSNLRYHVALKTIPYVDSSGQHFPTSPNGLKLEKYLFDEFNFTQKLGIWCGVREDEFAPVKNDDSKTYDSPTTCRNALMNLHRRYVEAAGGSFVQAEPTSGTSVHSSGDIRNTTNLIVCEISPLVSYAGEGLEVAVRGKTFVPPLVLELAPDKSTILINQGKENSQHSI